MDILDTSHDWELKKTAARAVLAGRGIRNVHIDEISERDVRGKITISYYLKGKGILNRIFRGGVSKEAQTLTVEREAFVKEMERFAGASAQQIQSIDEA